MSSKNSTFCWQFIYFKQANLGLRIFKSWTLKWIFKKQAEDTFPDIKLTPFLLSILTVIFSVHSIPKGSSCSALVVGKNVTIKESCKQGPSPSGTVCDLSCPLGYNLVGPPFKQCGNAGVWTPSSGPISCQGNDVGEIKTSVETCGCRSL